MRLRSRRDLACLLSVVVLALGCSAEPPVNPNVNENPPTPKRAIFNLVHAVPDAPAVDLYVDAKKTQISVDYRKSSGNVEITPGVHKLELRATASPATDAPLFAADLTLQPDSRTLLTALGRVADKNGKTQFKVTATPFGTVENLNVKVRMLHASPSAPQMELLAADSTSMLLDVGFGMMSGFASHQALPAGAKLGIWSPSRKSDMKPPVQLAQVTIPGSVSNGAVLTVIAFGEINPLADDKKSLSASVLDETSGALIDLKFDISNVGPKATVNIVHASPDAPAVDVVRIGGTKLVSSLSYQTASPTVELAGDSYPVNLLRTSDGAKLATLNLKLLPGLRWTVVAQGLLSGGTTPLTVVALPQPSKVAGQTQWRLIHAAPGAPNVDLLAGESRLIANLGYGAVSEPQTVDIPVGILRLQNSVNVKQRWDVEIPQSVADNTKDEVVSLVASGLVGNIMTPLSVLAVIESTGSPTMAPTVIPLTTTPVM